MEKETCESLSQQELCAPIASLYTVTTCENASMKGGPCCFLQPLSPTMLS